MPGKTRSRRTLYLHFGVHRTATTAIQATLFANRDKMRSGGFLYPLGVQRHIGLFNEIFAGRKNVDRVGRMLQARADAQKHDIHSLILSDEAVSKRPDLGVLAGFCDHFDVKVVIGLRRQDLWLESWWAQNVKGQWDRELCHRSWPEFMANRDIFHWIDYDRYIGHLEEVFGEGSVIPYVFERGQMPDGPIAAFCKAVGYSRFKGLKKAGGENISLTPETSEFVRHLPFIDAPMKVRLKLIEMAEGVDRRIRQQDATTLMIPWQERNRIMDQYAEGNRKVARKFFGRDQLFFDPLPDPSLAVKTPALPEDPELVMQRLVAPFMQELITYLSDR
ncbi:hypothetical protein [Paracoccus indicus]|uniref:hypothetical protein n=1 Tax=Paracoccus indicus TaxID=2079229 RepID=UPI0013B383E3|nr:hypothetical protein [Paracoccus indicus]